MITRAFLLLVALSSELLGSDITNPTLTQVNSKCVLVKSGGAYPRYKVFIGEEMVFNPKSNGIVKALFSISGKYVALSAGEVSLIDINEGQFEYGMAIVNCKSGKVKGYRKGKGTLIKKWEKGDRGIHIMEFLNLSARSGNKLP